MKKFLISICLALFSVLATLLLCEVIFRAFSSLNRASSVQWSDRPITFYAANAADSFQDYARDKEKAKGTFRIGVIGDSFTFATSMQLYNAFPQQLEQLFRLGSKDVEVINFGVPGYSTSHEIAATQKALEQYDVDLVLLQITLNDPQRKPYTPTGLTGENPFAESKAKQSGVLGYSKLAQFVKQRLHNTKTHQSYIDYYHDLFADKKNWRDFSSSLDQIKTICDNQKRPLFAAVFPLFGIALDGDYPFRELHKKVQDELARLKISYLDLFAVFEGIPLSRIQVIPGIDFHPNEIGHRIAAEAIFDWIERSEILPPEYYPQYRSAKRIDIKKPTARVEEKS